MYDKIIYDRISYIQGGQHNGGSIYNYIYYLCNLYSFLAVYLVCIKANLCVLIPKYCKCSKRNGNDRTSSQSYNIWNCYCSYFTDTTCHITMFFKVVL